MRIKHLAEYGIFQLFVSIARFCRFKSLHHLAKVIAFIVFYLFPIRKKVVLKNLRLAFPDKSNTELKQLAYLNYVSSALTFIEIPLIYYSTPAEIDSIIEFDDLTEIRAASEQGEGVILLTAHFGNWELGAVSFGLKLGKQINVLAKKQKNEFVAEKMKSIREKFGNKEILLGSSVKELYSTLKNGGVVGVVGDQRAPRDSIKVNFFNQVTPVFRGFATIALKLNSPVFVVLIARENYGKYRVYIEQIDYSDLGTRGEESEKKLLQRYIDILQKNIIKYPEQWFWMHNIWKYNI
ncbi:MAG: lysophospholipid acyltransferase family protein [Melioribacteraceae bacterium]|nr:lysophospholipid acyltransferase family protein [Melioribacteraceae bacterium]